MKSLSTLLLGTAVATLAHADLIYYVPADAAPGSDGSDLTVTVCLDFFGTPVQLSTEYRGMGGNPPVHAFEIAPNGGNFGTIICVEVCRTCPSGEVCFVDYFENPGFYGGYNPVPTPSLTLELPPGALECVDAEVLATEQPTSFALKGAFPNPFNPTTTIEFDLASTEMVNLSVHNINGQLVDTLVSGAMDQGTHQVTFDAASLSSGVYLYTLETGTFSATQKLVLVK